MIARGGTTPSKKAPRDAHATRGFLHLRVRIRLAEYGGGLLLHVGALLMAFRYVLLGVCVYAIFSYLHVPLVSIGLGLCALGAATIAASVWEVLKPAS